LWGGTKSCLMAQNKHNLNCFTLASSDINYLAVLFMKQTFIIIFIFFLFTNSFGQNIDTLQVIVLSPNKIEVADNYLTEYNKLQKEIIDKRIALKEQKTKDKKENIEAFKNQPDYTKKMYDNELNFYESLTIENYISIVVREYIAYRLYKPFKIKPRLVLVTTLKSSSDIKEYAELSKGKQNFFIINFPTMKIYKENGELKVLTKTELYSKKTNEILLSQDNIGLAKSGMTDYPMCSGDNWDCAFVNSVYPSLFEILKIIVDKKVETK
jgi:hypothetical protein